MSLENISLKRVRRTYEPEAKAWNDNVLAVPWEDIDPPLHKVTIFSLKNVFFFSHATPVQVGALKDFSGNGHSALLEAPTGSGKTLAFLIPLMERLLRVSEEYVKVKSAPPLTRHVVGFIVSPSRTLAEQTFVVGRNLSARFPYNIQFVLCDGVVSKPRDAMEKMQSGPRGAGFFVVTTPRDLLDLCAQLNIGGRTESGVKLFSTPANRFVLVVDEADLVFNNGTMRGSVEKFVTDCHQARVKLDFCFVGATVSTSPFAQEYFTTAAKQFASTPHVISLQTDSSFLSQLQNRFVLCESHDFLSVLVQIINLHASKKHFVFFNDPKVLLFAHRLFRLLSDQSSRPLLYISNIFMMHEGMNESTRMEQYSKFLGHRTTSGKGPEGVQKKKAGEKSNQVFAGGLKRQGKPSLGSGAILLCTDIAAFGLDVRDVDYVYHFEPPATPQSYVHRVGRVGRMGLRGSSVLLLPVVLDKQAAVSSRERKTTTNRFNTITNTKRRGVEVTGDSSLKEDLLPENHRLFVTSLRELSNIEQFTLPPLAPIASTLRNIISGDAKLVKMAKEAAMKVCETSCVWFDPKLAVQSFLLD
ncbi:DEAD/DEAH box helicase/Helicase conserved C-terminal domain containing protein, putative [Angomonas deanei]|uniref:ATP-dependent RNA helicase n=1 Tax=Angomonas deanei TaxID=59799 RepID=A0A7G2CER7_9TRYP|nr:DEAD/DEAH box helicase/Helicase conserved C-terminal domain containing protein, putative [Angomonas deanei]